MSLSNVTTPKICQRKRESHFAELTRIFHLCSYQRATLVLIKWGMRSGIKINRVCKKSGTPPVIFCTRSHIPFHGVLAAGVSSAGLHSHWLHTLIASVNNINFQYPWAINPAIKLERRQLCFPPCTKAPTKSDYVCSTASETHLKMSRV
jgi:hypothetical protein